MRVAIEAASLALTSGGLARYTSELSLALARCFPDDEFFLISDQPFRMPDPRPPTLGREAALLPDPWPLTPGPGREAAILPGPRPLTPGPGPPPNLQRGAGPRNAVERRWWLWGIHSEMRRLGADLIHGPDFAVPYLGRRPSVLTLHDLSPWMNDRWHHNASRVQRRTPLLLDLGIATMVITPGESVRKQAIERFRLKPDRVVAVPEAAASWFRPGPPAPAANPYMLFVGTLEPRKNIPLLLAAWREVRKHHAVDLVVAGRRRDDFPALDPEPGLRVAGEVADAELPPLYSGALAFVYPSAYEGFGLPVLEAMQCGACVIASRAVAEAGGDAAIYADDEQELAAAMRAVIESPDQMPERRARSLARAALFSWESAARATYEVYREARRRFAR